MIYIGVPVHDERHTVGALMWSIRKVMRAEDLDFRLVVVDDGSTDGTAEVLEPYGRVLPLVVLTHRERRGYAASLESIVREVLDRSGYHKRDALVTLQGDFTHPPDAIPEMIRGFQSGADLVVGRPLDPRQPPPAVRLGRLGASLLTRRLPSPAEVEAPLCGFRLYRLFLLYRALEDLPEGASLLQYEGWAANAELLARVWPHVRQVRQVEFTPDYTRRYRGSRFRPLAELWRLYRAGGDRRLRNRVPEPVGRGNGS